MAQRAVAQDLEPVLVELFPQVDDPLGSLEAAEGPDDTLVITATRQRPGEARELVNAAARAFVASEQARRIARLEASAEVWRSAAADAGGAEALEQLARVEADAASVPSDLVIVEEADLPADPRPSRTLLVALVAVGVCAGAALGAVLSRRRRRPPAPNARVDPSDARSPTRKVRP